MTSVGSVGFSSNYSPTNQSAAVTKFKEYMEKDAGEKMIEVILNSMGLTLEDLEKMTPEERKEVLAKVHEIIKEKIEETAGIDASSDKFSIEKSSTSILDVSA